ncbi:MAG: penicillin-binding protein activator, partial [Pontibacterium sp.]
IWTVLQKIPTPKLQTLVQDQGNTYYQQGWVELALIYRQSFRGDVLSNSLADWNTIWQSHPARTTPPEMGSPEDVGTITAGKIGVLLPASGKLAAAGQAIREGLTSAYYQQLTQGNSVPLLVFIDSETINTVDDVKSAIAEHELEFIIGPLEKRLVSTLNQATDLPIPVLALNYDQDANINQIFQFGLAPEDEARQAAELAWQEGHRAALALTPQTGWGNRVSNAFKDTFELLGGTVTGAVSYGDQRSLSEDISFLLETDKSEERAKSVGQLTNLRMEFEERRRDDASIIFLSATPQNARQILPILAFHFAGDLPVLSSSHIFSGTENAQADRDLNGVRFVTTPWTIQTNSATKQALSAIRNTNSRYASLYALGADAFSLFPHLNQLNIDPSHSIQGETGKLSIDGDKRIRRTLEWAQFNQGTPQILQTQTTKTTGIVNATQ